MPINKLCMADVEDMPMPRRDTKIDVGSRNY